MPKFTPKEISVFFATFWAKFPPASGMRLGQAFVNYFNIKPEDEVENIYNETDRRKVIDIIYDHYATVSDEDYWR